MWSVGTEGEQGLRERMRMKPSRDSKLSGVIGEVVALHPEKLLLFKLHLVALGVDRFL